jgi:hypothetical protein
MGETLCSSCHAPRDTTGRYCRGCRAAYMRRWRNAGRETRTDSDRTHHAVRKAATMRLWRWGIRPVRCQVCGNGKGWGRLEVHHPTFAGPDASWTVYIAHAHCHRQVNGNPPALIDLRTLDREHLPEWLAYR